MYLWDERADMYEREDNLRRIVPVEKLVGENGVIHYFFNQSLFHNPKYTIPTDDYELFQKFLEGGSREYPSDGNIPIDIAAREAVLILKEIEVIRDSPGHMYHSSIKSILKNRGPIELIRGAIRLYLSNISTRDWRRKRSTDDIDMWIPNVPLLEYILKKLNWKYNRDSGEWVKKVTWNDIWTGVTKSSVLIASNDIFQATDFGAGSYLTGSRIKDIINTLNDKESLVVNFLLEHENKSTQSKLKYGVNIPKTTLSRLLEKLEAKNIINIERIGKAKKIELTGWFLGKK